MKPWKRIGPGRGHVSSRRLQWGHGDEAVEEAVSFPGCGPSRFRFNGATAMKPWKRMCRIGISRLAMSLQWGHGDEAVEERTPHVASNTHPSCFNGATAMKPWKRSRNSKRYETHQ